MLGLMQREQGNEIVVQCTIDNELYAIDKSGAIEVHPSCLGKFDYKIRA